MDVSQEEFDQEKARRVYYQDIVYAVCNSLDRIFSKRPGKGVVCGTVETPTRQVQDLLPQIEARCKEWSEMKAAAQPGDEPSHAQSR